MRGSRFTQKQIVSALQEHDAAQWRGEDAISTGSVPAKS